MISACGNKSLIKASNKGRSYLRNFGMLEFLMALIRTSSSELYLSALFREPAITSTLLTALIPKS